MHSLRPSRISAERTFAGFFWCMGESLRTLSRKFGYVEKISERAKGFSSQQGHDSLFYGRTLARGFGEKAR